MEDYFMILKGEGFTTKPCAHCVSFGLFHFIPYLASGFPAIESTATRLPSCSDRENEEWFWLFILTSLLKSGLALFFISFSSFLPYLWL